MFERRRIITVVILFIMYLGVVYAARERKLRPKFLQPVATASHQGPVTNYLHLLTAQPIAAETNIHNRLD
jgi:hypothetical protein